MYTQMLLLLLLLRDAMALQYAARPPIFHQPVLYLPLARISQKTEASRALYTFTLENNIT